MRVKDILGILDRRVDRDVTDAVPAKRSAATAWHSKLAAQATALVELRKQAFVVAETDEVERGNVLAEAVQSTERLSALAAGDTAAALAPGCHKGSTDRAEVVLQGQTQDRRESVCAKLLRVNQSQKIVQGGNPEAAWLQDRCTQQQQTAETAALMSAEAGSRKH